MWIVANQDVIRKPNRFPNATSHRIQTILLIRDITVVNRSKKKDKYHSSSSESDDSSCESVNIKTVLKRKVRNRVNMILIINVVVKSDVTN